MAKGYLVANIRVTNQDKFQEFSGMAGPAIKNMVVKSLRAVRLPTDWKDVDGIVMMIEFESKEAADTFYHSKGISGG